MVLIIIVINGSEIVIYCLLHSTLSVLELSNGVCMERVKSVMSDLLRMKNHWRFVTDIKYKYK